MGAVKVQPLQVAAPHEDGDVESAHGALKGRLEQQLLLRGHRDFATGAAYEDFLGGVLLRANQARQDRLAAELAVMRPLPATALPEYVTTTVRVNAWSTVQVARNTYSVPSRLIGEVLTVRLYEERVEFSYHGVPQLTASRQRGARAHAINYRHVIGWLLRKPGAFAQYRFRADLFPSAAFRWAYDRLRESGAAAGADREYLRVLNHAALTLESRVEQALLTLRARGAVPRLAAVLAAAPDPAAAPPALAPLPVNLREYNTLLTGAEVGA